MKLQFLVILNCCLLAAYAGTIKNLTQPDDTISSTDADGLSGPSESTMEANIIKPDSKASVSDSTLESEAIKADTMEPDTKAFAAMASDTIALDEPVDAKLAAEAHAPIIILESPPSQGDQGIRSPYRPPPPWLADAQKANVSSSNMNNLGFSVNYMSTG